MKLAGSRGLRRRWGAVVVAAGIVLPVSGCGLFGSGKEIATPTVMTVSSGQFVSQVMPVQFTCAWSKVTTPPLSWGGEPPGTKSIAVVVDDSGAPITPYVYWIVFNIDPQAQDLMEGQLPPGSRQARNSAGTIGYKPPCPGSGGHTYRFTVYALNTELNLPNGTSLQSAWRAIADAAIGRGRLTATATVTAPS